MTRSSFRSLCPLHAYPPISFVSLFTVSYELKSLWIPLAAWEEFSDVQVVSSGVSGV